MEPSVSPMLGPTWSALLPGKKRASPICPPEIKYTPLQLTLIMCLRQKLVPKPFETVPFVFQFALLASLFDCRCAANLGSTNNGTLLTDVYSSRIKCSQICISLSAALFLVLMGLLCLMLHISFSTSDWKVLRISLRGHKASIKIVCSMSAWSKSFWDCLRSED